MRPGRAFIMERNPRMTQRRPARAVAVLLDPFSRPAQPVEDIQL
ncbi:hypothetical protein HMPREF9946_03198 [Acetobacteraceae bacterium AT-5844]|nr:hypothetical protein HMPREF9946_03198 [Acetobacteraceae bacterium AT-5844]